MRQGNLEFFIMIEETKSFWVCYFCKKNIYELTHVCDRTSYNNERRACSFCGYLFADNLPHWCRITTNYN